MIVCLSICDLRILIKMANILCVELIVPGESVERKLSIIVLASILIVFNGLIIFELAVAIIHNLLCKPITYTYVSILPRLVNSCYEVLI